VDQGTGSGHENGSAIDGYYWDSAGNLHSFILDL
jgi:hypothetical protein